MRTLPILNFRDLGGYQNNEGKKIKPQKIFRGASLEHLTYEDVKYMEEVLNIRYIFDLRDEQEALAAPDVHFPKSRYKRIGALRLSHQKFQGLDLGTLLKQKMTYEHIFLLKEYVQAGYREMAFSNLAYMQIFQALLKNDGNVYFHCTAGKDRTGIAAFLIMLALGVNEHDCFLEYLLSNKYLKSYNAVLQKKLHIPNEFKEQCSSLLYVEKENLELTKQAIFQRYISYEDFLQKEYQLDFSKREQLRSLYCI